MCIRDRAFRVNALGCRHVADACRRAGAYLCTVSTDYVFDGTSDHPYDEWAIPNPASVYGRSKLAGEGEALTLAPGASVVRTSWLCGAGGPNFVKTMLRLADSGPPEVTVVDDQRGCPTFTEDLAAAIRRLVAARLPGLFHVTNAGPTSWWGLAREVFELAGADPDRVLPITTDELVPARAATRPRNSVLDNAALRLSDLPALADHRVPLARLVAALRAGRPA